MENKMKKVNALGFGVMSSLINKIGCWKVFGNSRKVSGTSVPVQEVSAIIKMKFLGYQNQEKQSFSGPENSKRIFLEFRRNFLVWNLEQDMELELELAQY